MQNTEATTETKVKQALKPGRPKGHKIKWPTGALLVNMFRYNKDRAIADKLKANGQSTSIPGVFLKRERLNKADSGNPKVGKFSYVPPEKRSTAKKVVEATAEAKSE